jgi:hypothetical protein
MPRWIYLWVITSGSFSGQLLLGICLSLLLAPEANIANDRKEEQDTIVKLLFAAEKAEDSVTHHKAMLSPQIAFVSKQIVFDAPIHEPKSIFPVMLASRLDRREVKAYVVASLKFNEESEEHFKYERGLPIITATTMSAMSRRESRMAHGRNGRMSSKNRMPVMMQYITAIHVFYPF